MIRKLTDNDSEKVLAYLMDEPSFNLFIIGDIEAFGFNSSFQELWGEFSSEGNLKGVLLRFYQSYIFYSNGDFNVIGFANIMKKDNKPIFLSGKTDIIERFEKTGLKLGEKQVTYFAECLSKENLKLKNLDIKQASLQDVDRIIDLRKSISEFHVKEDTREILIKSMAAKNGRTYYTEENDFMTACASTTAENSMSAMIVGVCTRDGYRRNGLATSILENLLTDMINEGKILCLFYDNPEAGRIYQRLGFKEIGKWTMYK